MTTFDSPYNFVPLSSHVHFPDWDDSVSQELPFRDGLSGSFDLIVEATTPLYSRDDLNKSGFLSHDGTPETAFLKGSTLRGALREVVAIASFGKFSNVDDRRFGIRDIGRGDTPYAQKMRAAQPGWLYVEGKGDALKAYIRPCKEGRVARENLEKFHLEQTGKRWSFDWNGLAERNERWLAKREVSADLRSDGKRNSKMIASNLGRGKTDGKLVFFGYISNDPKRSKKHGYFFYEEQEKREEISPDVWRNFVWAHSSSQQKPSLNEGGQEPGEAWGYWQKRLEDHPEEPVPVYYLHDASGITDLGLAKMFRIASKYGVYDAIANVGDQHLSDRRADLAELLFGYVGCDEDESSGTPRALRGRVAITQAEVEKKTVRGRTLAPVRAVLSSPRASFYPAYLRANAHGGATRWDDAHPPQVNGWKRYPARGSVVENPPRNENNSKQETVFEPLDKGVRFRARVYFHNLRPVELGALLWSVDFGGHFGNGSGSGFRSDLVHHIGMAKPLGYGEVVLSVQNFDARPNDPASSARSIKDYVGEFEAYMTAVLHELDWATSEQIVSLLAMSNPKYGDTESLKYPALRKFKDIKNNGKALGSPDGFDQTLEILECVAKKLKEPAEAQQDKLALRKQERQARVDRITRKRDQEEQARLRRQREAAQNEERARRAAMTPLGRAQEDLSKMSEGEALEMTRTRLCASGTPFETERQQEAMREATHLKYYKRWSSGKTFDSSLSHGPAKLKQYAACLQPPGLGELAADGGADPSALDNLPSDEADKLEKAGDTKDLLKSLWHNEIEGRTDWSLAGAEQFFRQVENALPKRRKMKKADRKWFDVVEEYLEERRDDDDDDE